MLKKNYVKQKLVDYVKFYRYTTELTVWQMISMFFLLPQDSEWVSYQYIQYVNHTGGLSQYDLTHIYYFHTNFDLCIYLHSPILVPLVAWVLVDGSV